MHPSRNRLKDKKVALKKAEKELSKLEVKNAAANQRADEAKNVETESVVKKLLISGMSAEKIIEN